MSSFPPKEWQVRYLADMDTLTGDDISAPVSLEALMAVRPADGEEGTFRFILAGASKLKLSIPVQKVLPMEVFKGLNIELEMELGTQVGNILHYRKPYALINGYKLT